MKTVRSIIDNVQSISIEDIGGSLHDEIWEQLPNNGGNVLCVEKDSEFGKYLICVGFKFTKSWEWVVVFR